MDIAFIVTGQQQAHEGVVRPFVNFAKALRGKYRFFFLLLDCSKSFSNTLQSSNNQVINCESKKELIEKVREVQPAFIFCDDDFKRLKLLKKLKSITQAKTVVYVQVLYGSHVVANCYDLSSQTLREKIVFRSIKYLPFAFFSQKYASLLSYFDLIIANSKVTATFLHSLYDIEVGGIVYPPIDVEVFQPTDQKGGKELTLYLGSHLGDVKQSFLERIVGIIGGKGFSINLFGNPAIGAHLLSKYGKTANYKSVLSDVELAKMYSRSKMTLCPQKWEQFGYVPVESMACGTPVLAFNCMGFQETIDGTTGWLANNEVEYLQILTEKLSQSGFSFKQTRQKVLEEFSSDVCGHLLEELLVKYFG